MPGHVTGADFLQSVMTDIKTEYRVWIPCFHNILVFLVPGFYP